MKSRLVMFLLLVLLPTAMGCPEKTEDTGDAAATTDAKAADAKTDDAAKAADAKTDDAAKADGE